MMFLNAVASARRRYPVITNGLKLYLDAYNLDSYSGSGSVWYDISNSAYNFNVVGATWAVSGGRRYFELDGVNDYIWGNSDTTLFDITTSGWTWSMWMYHVTAPQGLDVLVNATYSGYSPYNFDHRNNTGNTVTGNGWASIIGASVTPYWDRRTVYAQTITTGTWRHITFTFTYTSDTACTLRIYINGTQVVTQNHTLTAGQSWTQANNTSTRPILGAFYFVGSATFGRFNNIRVGELLNYNRTLSATEISDNYNSTKSNYGL
jgi:hypothetical protein